MTRIKMIRFASVCGMALLMSLSGTAWSQVSASTQRLSTLQQQRLAAQRLAYQRQVAARQAAQRNQSRGAMTARGGSPAVSSMTSGRGGVKSTASSASLGGIRTAMASFSADMGRMPTGSEGLGALLNRPPGATNWRGPYISSVNWRKALTDPWGNMYNYMVQGAAPYQSHVISSNGPDGIAGTRDDLSIQF